MGKRSGTRRRQAPKRFSGVLSLAPHHAVAVLALVFAGFVVSIYLTYVHHRLQVEPGWRSICSVSSSVDCDAVISSPYGSIAGVPLSVFGTWFYAVIAVVAVLGLRGNPWRFPRSPALALFAAASFAAALSLALALISVLWLRSLCLLCLGLYAVNLALFGIAYGSFRSSGEGVRQAVAAERRHWKTRRGAAAWSGLGPLALLGLMIILYSMTSGPRSAVCEAVTFSMRGGEPITLIVYSDFQCPACRALDVALRPMRPSASLRIVARHYPLDKACNPGLKRSPHPGACLQARAALCAGAQGQYDRYSERLFDERPVDEAGLVGLAGTLHLDRSEFETCLWSEDTTRQLAESIADAGSAGVKATPTLFVNGRPHVGRLSSTDLGCLADALSSRRPPGTSLQRSWYPVKMRLASAAVHHEPP